MAQNQAAWLDGVGHKFRVADIPMPKAAPGRVIVRNRAVAANPADWKTQDAPSHLKTWPMVLGEDLAGEVVEVGEGVESVKKGDRVLAHSDALLTQNPADGGFALYTSVPASVTALIPSVISYAEASVVPLAFDTAAIGLYLPTADGYLGLPYPSLKPSPSGKTIVVWGGSSSVGALAIQLAVASGIKVVATSSPHNFEFCKHCGADEVFDHKDPTIVDKLVQAVQASGGTFAGIYDAISLPDQSYPPALAILEKLGGGNLATTLPAPRDTPANVKASFVIGINPLTHPLWVEYITPALESGQLKCLPEPLVVGRGLEHVEEAVDKNRKGVSARKVVVEL